MSTSINQYKKTHKSQGRSPYFGGGGGHGTVNYGYVAPQYKKKQKPLA